MQPLQNAIALINSYFTSLNFSNIKLVLYLKATAPVRTGVEA